MTGFILFMVGSMVGALVGVTVMCVLQINRISDNYTTEEEDKNA